MLPGRLLCEVSGQRHCLGAGGQGGGGQGELGGGGPGGGGRDTTQHRQPVPQGWQEKPHTLLGEPSWDEHSGNTANRL